MLYRSSIPVPRICMALNCKAPTICILHTPTVDKQRHNTSVADKSYVSRVKILLICICLDILVLPNNSIPHKLLSS